MEQLWAMSVKTRILLFNALENCLDKLSISKEDEIIVSYLLENFLFQTVSFNEIYMVYILNSLGSEFVGKISFSFSSHLKKEHMIRGISARMIKNLSKIGFLRWLGKYKYVMPPTMINMIGELKEKD